MTIAGVRVWIDEAELGIGDSLIEKISEGVSSVDFLAVVLSPDAVASRWVQKEVEIAMNREISGRSLTVLPLLYKNCKLPLFLEGKVYADFTEPTNYNYTLRLLLQRLGLDVAPYVLVFDLGGGTMDAAVIHVNPGYAGKVDVEKLQQDIQSLGLTHAKRVRPDRRRKT